MKLCKDCKWSFCDAELPDHKEHDFYWLCTHPQVATIEQKHDPVLGNHKEIQRKVYCSTARIGSPDGWFTRKFLPPNTVVSCGITALYWEEK